MMAPRQPETFPPVTPGPIRSHGCRDLLVYCESGWGHPSAVMNADWLPDEIRLRSRMAEFFGRHPGHAAGLPAGVAARQFPPGRLRWSRAQLRIGSMRSSAD